MQFDRKKFFDGYKDLFDPTLDQEQVDAIDFLLGAFESDPKWKDVRHVSYAFATIYHETAATLRPITEYGGVRYFDKYDTGKLAKALGNTPDKDGDGYKYRGRGFVQITGRDNYEKFGIEDNPEDALKPEVAFTILSVGMQVGSFTGKKLSTFIKGSKCDYLKARQVINGMDKAALIAGYARNFEKMLRTSAAQPKTSESTEGTTNAHTPTDAATKPPIDSGHNETGLGAKLELTAEGITAETTGGSAQNVVIEKRTEEGWLKKKWKEIAALFTGGGLLDGATEKAQQVQALGLSADFWKRLFYLAIAGVVVYLVTDWWKHRSKIKEEIARDEVLARENSMPGNFVQFAPTEYLQEYRARGYKVITR